MARQTLYVTPMPEPGQEEFADANWYHWVVIGHEDEAQIDRSVIAPHVQAFWTMYNAEHPSNGGTTYPHDEAWEADKCRRFLDYMDAQGYTTFEPTHLTWATAV